MKNNIVIFQSRRIQLRHLLLILITCFSFCSQELTAQTDKKELTEKRNIAYYKDQPYTGIAVTYASKFRRVVTNGHKDMVEEKWLKYEEEYSNGILQKQTEYYPSKQKKVELDYVKGQCTEWYEPLPDAAPQIKVTGAFTKGLIKKSKREGKWTYYHPNGKINSENKYDNDKLNGEAIFYQEDGTRSQEGSFKNNKKDGTWVYYNDKGEKWFTAVYAKGDEVSRTYEKGMPELKKSDAKLFDGSFLIQILTLPFYLLYGLK
jgi:antitoxin component YwqK of YwqJK toxin-antitoxin module